MINYHYMGSYKWQVYRMLIYLILFCYISICSVEEKPLKWIYSENWDKDVRGLTDKVLYIDLNAA